MSDKTYPTMQTPPRATYDQPSSLNIDYSDAPEAYHPAAQQAQRVPQPQQVPQAIGPSSPPPEKASRICGLARQTFWLIIILVIVVVAAAVGGGVGGALAVENARSKAVSAAQATSSPASSAPTASTTSSPTASASGSTSSASPSAYVPALPGSVLLVDSSCPTSAITTISVRGILNSYNCTEQTDYPQNDITALTAYTLQQCVEACVLYNISENNKICLGVAHSPHMKDLYNSVTGNCYLKKAFGDRRPELNDWTTVMLRA